MHEPLLTMIQYENEREKLCDMLSRKSNNVLNFELHLILFHCLFGSLCVNGHHTKCTHKIRTHTHIFFSSFLYRVLDIGMDNGNENKKSRIIYKFVLVFCSINTISNAIHEHPRVDVRATDHFFFCSGSRSPFSLVLLSLDPQTDV